MITFKEKVKKAREVILEAINKYGGKLAVACSFGKDSAVLTHLAIQIKPNIQIFSIMTPFKPIDTFMYKDWFEREYNLNIKTFKSKEDPEKKIKLTCGKIVKLKDLYKYDPDGCCMIFKVEPTKEAIKKLKLRAWISGLRKDEGRTRIDYKHVEEKDGLVKVNPILNFTETDIWKYLACYGVRPHPWYKRGYRSLGCEPCTKLVDDSAEERAGRWSGTRKAGGECGIHTKSLVYEK